MKIYGHSLQFDPENPLFCEIQDSDHPYPFFLTGDFLDLCHSQNRFGDQARLDDFILSWLQENEFGRFDKSFYLQLKDHDFYSAVKFRDGIAILKPDLLFPIPNKSDLTSLSIELLAPDEFSARFYGQDLRNRFALSPNTHLDSEEYKNLNFICYLCAIINNYVVGILRLSDPKVKTDHSELILSFIAVDDEWQSLGIGKILTEHAFQLASELKAKLKSTPYKDIGRQRLKKINESLAQKYGVIFQDEDSPGYKRPS